MIRNRLYLLITCLIIFIIFQLMLPRFLFFVQVITILAAFFIMTGFRTSVNFLISSIIIFIYGLILAIYAFNQQIYDQSQYQYIVAHILLTASILLTWLIIHELRVLKEKMEKLHMRLQHLEKYDVDTKALSFQEFKERAQLIATGMKRRGEKGQLISFTMKEDIDPVVQVSLRQAFVKICLDTIRLQFDLVTSPSKDNVLVFLQAADNDEINTFVHRVGEKMKQNFNFINLPYYIDTYETQDIESVLKSIHYGGVSS
ncbi:hypothetical protein CAI16_10335 [Virgibacillus dokdonensis]|uniref:GGDEF domain-containing protein n=1 Tax=Virgibacillus dokdonensis TaxID=302167 RepID=A0A3E0WRE8_9BACI|nr:hypothetical protein [Virgibacillus dokdonensis]RFA34773.1 hypothetical protein CAI16_10335 [Virgibacillus dokdonensis]